MVSPSLRDREENASRHLPSSSGERSETGGPLVILRPIEDRTGEAPKAICSTPPFPHPARDRVAPSRAAGSPGLRREGAACRRMTKERKHALSRRERA